MNLIALSTKPNVSLSEEEDSAYPEESRNSRSYHTRQDWFFFFSVALTILAFVVIA